MLELPEEAYGALDCDFLPNEVHRMPDGNRKRSLAKGCLRLSKARLAELIEQATIDCYNESEAAASFLAVIEDQLDLPFKTFILDEEVLVSGVDADDHGGIVVICRKGKVRQRIPILHCPLPSPAPAGSEWIEAYRAWFRGAW